MAVEDFSGDNTDRATNRRNLGLLNFTASSRLPIPALRHLFSLLALLIAAPVVQAEPQPGDVYREYLWTDKGRWQRITGPDATMDGAKQFLPNAVNTVELADLAGATRVEAQLELLQSHYGTIGHSIRLNHGAWIPIPDTPHVPGKFGNKEGASHLWLTMLYPTVDLPLPALRQGANVFELSTRSGPMGLGSRWPQSIVYGIIFRVYYGAEKPAAIGAVVAPTGTVGRYGTIELSADATAAPGRAIRRIDFFARYLGYDWRGEGVMEKWHYHTFFGELRRNAGSAVLAPWRVAWDVRDVPAQEQPVQVIARIQDDTGLCRLTAPLTLEKFRGMPHTRIFRAHAIPQAWQIRAGKRQVCKITQPVDGVRLKHATDIHVCSD